jgi:hypothetical protein
MSVQYRVPAYTSKFIDANGVMNKDWYMYLAGLAGTVKQAIRRLVPGSVLTGSVATYYTASNVAATITAANLTNSTGGPISATVYLVPAGQTAGPAYLFISAHSVAAGGSYQCPEIVGQVLERGGTIQAFGSGLTFSVSGTEVS